MKAEVVMVVAPGDKPHRYFDGNAGGYAVHAVYVSADSSLRLHDLTTPQKLTYLQDLSRECLLLAGEIERAGGRP